MNNSRRKRISKIADALNELKGQIDELYEEEQEAFENIPESLQGTERYEVAENAVDMLESASMMMAAPITARSRWMDVSWFAPTPSMSFGAMRRTFGNISHSSPTRSLWKPMSLTARRSMRSPRVRRS